MIYRTVITLVCVALAFAAFMLAPSNETSASKPAAPAQPVQPSSNKNFNL